MVKEIWENEENKLRIKLYILIFQLILSDNMVVKRKKAKKRTIKKKVKKKGGKKVAFGGYKIHPD